MAAHAERHIELAVSPEPLSEVPSGQDSNFRLARRITYYALDVVEVILAARFLLKAFGANAQSSFVAFVNAISAPLSAPFEGIFSNTSAPSTVLFEWSTLVAMAVYLLVAIGIVQLFKLIIKGGRPLQDETLER